MDEHVLPAIVSDNEAETLLRVEEFDDAFAFANDLWGHSAATGSTAAEASATSTAAAAESTSASSSVAKAAASASAAAEAAAVTKASTSAAAEAAAFLGPALLAEIFFEETVALVAAAPAAVAFAPFIETHARPNFRMPTNN
jgi:hypothetical protein